MSRVGAQPFKPFFWTDVNGSHPKSQFIERPTYRRMKKDLPALMAEYGMEEVHVFRSKRGEWGEWYEIWQRSNGKLRKIKEGWN